MIFLKNIQLSFADRVLFDDITWTIGEKSRIGLVGNNGAGKTTLLKTVVGLVDLDGGSVEIADRKGRTLGYLPQDLAELEPVPLLTHLKRRSGIADLEEDLRDHEQQIAQRAHRGEHPEDGGPDRLLEAYERLQARFAARDGYAFEARAKGVLKGLGFRESDFEKRCTEFSGGWKMRIQLAAILLARPDIMLLDEPTNHLDTESLEWLEGYLGDFPGTLMVIAHDRVFLDKMISTIAEIDRGRLTLYRGNYAAYLKEKAAREEAREKAAALQAAEIARTEAFVERFRYKATKAKQVQSRVRLLEKMAPVTQETKARSVRIRFPEAPPSGREVLRVVDLGHRYGEMPVFDGLSFTLWRGQKAALVGANGSGKSTLSRLISGVETPCAGSVAYGKDVRAAFFSQETAESLNYTGTVWEEIAAVPSRSTDQHRRDLLGAFLFSGDDIHKPVAVLSGGEKARLALLKILLTDSNFLILDEPTNSLDLKTKDVFQEALLAYGGTVLIVSHDRYFLDNLADRVFELREGRCIDYPGNYSYFIEKREALRAGETPSPAEARGETAPAGRDLRRQAAEERTRLSRQRREAQKRLAEAEARIARLETRQREIEGLLCDPDVLRDGERCRGLHQELRQGGEALEALYEAWQELAREAEALG